MATITIPGMFLAGDHASRPAATAVGGGSLYACSDHTKVYQSDGATWSDWFDPSSGAGTTFTGNVLKAAPPGTDFTQTGSGGTAGTAYLMPVAIPGSMLLRSLRVKVATGAAGTVQWGLFDCSSAPTSCTKLAGGSGALASANWQEIAASGGPVAIGAGNYLLIVHLPAATAPALVVGAVGTGAAQSKSQAAYVWDDTPTVASGWTATTATFVVELEGDIDGSTQW